MFNLRNLVFSTIKEKISRKKNLSNSQSKYSLKNIKTIQFGEKIFSLKYPEQFSSSFQQQFVFINLCHEINLKQFASRQNCFLHEVLMEKAKRRGQKHQKHRENEKNHVK